MMSKTAPPVDWRESPRPQLSPILASALRAFTENGYHGATVRDIARRCGVTQPVLYYHYNNKEGILVALLESALEHLQALCQLALAAGGADPNRRFLNLIECIVLFMCKNGDLGHLDAENRFLAPDLRAVYAANRDQIEQLLRDAIREGVQAGIFREQQVSETSRALLGMFQAIPNWYVDGGSLTPATIAETYTEIAARVVGAAYRPA